MSWYTAVLTAIRYSTIESRHWVKVDSQVDMLADVGAWGEWYWEVSGR